MRSTQATFHVPQERERPFLREYMVDAWDRFERSDAVDSAWFWRFGQAVKHGSVELEGGTTFDDGGVILVVNGDPDPDPAVEAERDRWRTLEAEGFIDGWETQGYRPEYENAREKMREQFGQRGGELLYELRPLAARTTIGLLETFDRDLPAVGDPSEENPRPVGEWVLIHLLMKQNGHAWDDEIGACRKAIENRVHSLAHFHGSESALDELDATIAALEDVRRDVEGAE